MAGEDNGMTKTTVKIIIYSLLVISGLFAQRETVGFEFNQHDRKFDSMQIESNDLSMTYRTELPSGTRFAASLGLDYSKLFEDNSAKFPLLKSTDQVFIKLGGLQKYKFLYAKGAVEFYSIKGNTVEITGSYSKVIHHNVYRIFEFPLSAGLAIPINAFDFYIGVNKVYFYGTNEKDISVNNSGIKTDLGSDDRRTFKSELGLGAEATVLYRLSENLEFELNFTRYEGKDYSVRLSVWGPLKRMFRTH